MKFGSLEQIRIGFAKIAGESSTSVESFQISAALQGEINDRSWFGGVFDRFRGGQRGVSSLSTP